MAIREPPHHIYRGVLSPEHDADRSIRGGHTKKTLREQQEGPGTIEADGNRRCKLLCQERKATTTKMELTQHISLNEETLTKSRTRLKTAGTVLFSMLYVIRDATRWTSEVIVK